MSNFDLQEQARLKGQCASEAHAVPWIGRNDRSHIVSPVHPHGSLLAQRGKPLSLQDRPLRNSST